MIGMMEDPQDLSVLTEPCCLECGFRSRVVWGLCFCADSDQTWTSIMTFADGTQLNVWCNNYRR